MFDGATTRSHWMKIERRMFFLETEFPHLSICRTVDSIATGFDLAESVRAFNGFSFPVFHGSGPFLLSKDG